MIASQRQHGNNDPRWQLAAANADLLEGDYDHAVRILEPDANANTETPEIDIAIATAYYERGISGNTPEDLGNAREAIGRALDKEPRDPVALFNRALIDEGIGLYSQAINDWQQYLQVDAAGEWSREAKEHLASCLKMKEKKEKATDGQSLLTPEAIGRFGTSKVADNEIDRRIEDYEFKVFTDYYPALTSEDASSRDSYRANSERTIRRLAEISLLKHNDRLLLDLVASQKFGKSMVPARELASAVNANRTGDEQQALRQAEKAFADFKRIGNRAGSLRAQFEVLYAMQFMSRAKECVYLAHRLAADTRKESYSWLTAETETEAGFCNTMVGNLAGAAEDLRFAARDASDAHYEVALDRAQVGAAGMQWQTGSISTAWNIAQDGLRHFWTSAVPYERGESFCDLLDEMAEQRQQWHLQSSFLKESLTLVEGEQDRLAEAQVLVRLAGSELMLNQPAEAKSYLARALLIFRAAPQTHATQNQELMVRINLAKAEAASHDYLSSVSQLEELRPEVVHLHENLSLIEFYTTLGEAYRKLGNGRKAAESDLAAVSVFRAGLSSLSSVRDRLTWYRQVSAAYRSLVQLRINENESAEALVLWQEYRRIGPLPNRHQASNESGRSRVDKLPESQLSIVFADLPDGLYAWAVKGQNIKAMRLSAPYDAVTQLGHELSEQCSSPYSDLDRLLKTGRQLHKILIEPFAALLTEDATILIQPDDELARIPFNVLVDGQGKYLNSTHTIAIAPFSMDLDRSLSPLKRVDSRDSALLVENDSENSTVEREDPQSAREIRVVASFFPSSTILRPAIKAQMRFLDLLKYAEVFHYAGHSASTGNGSALVLQEGSTAGAYRSISFRSDDLEGTNLGHARLAVLSGCQTDRGQGAHWLDRDNIAVTLLSVGFPEVVASRWNIDSGATTALMQEFYENVTNGASVPRSLRMATEKVRQTPGYSHPYFWAAFSVLERPATN